MGMLLQRHLKATLEEKIDKSNKEVAKSEPKESIPQELPKPKVPKRKTVSPYKK